MTTQPTWIPTTDAAKRWLHQDDFVYRRYESGWQVAARRRKSVWQQVAWFAMPILTGIGIYWAGSRFDPAGEYQWFLTTLCIISITTGISLVVILNLVYREHRISTMSFARASSAPPTSLRPTI